MRSLGQSPTQQQIDAIIRDMDLDNDGVIDLAEFMIRMMALTTKVLHFSLKLPPFFFLSGMNPMISSRNCILQQSSVTCWDQCVHRECHCKICRHHSFCGVIGIAVVGKSFADMQAAPEEDLKHVFDVLDKSGEGMITADSLRSAIKVCEALSCLFAPAIIQHAYDIQS